MNDEQASWERLRAEVADANARERDELAAIEAMLAAQAGHDDPLPAADITRMVAAATAEEGRLLTFPRWTRAVAAMAAFALAPKTLVAATLVTTIAVVSYAITHSTQTLGYQDAVAILMDQEGSDESRIAGQLTVFGDVHESLTLVQEVAAGTDVLAASAQAVLAALRAVAANGGAFQLQALPGSHLVLGDVVADATANPAARAAALNQLAAHLEYGILALTAAAAQPGPEPLRLGAAAALDKIRRQLAL